MSRAAGERMALVFLFPSGSAYFCCFPSSNRRVENDMEKEDTTNYKRKRSFGPTPTELVQDFRGGIRRFHTPSRVFLRFMEVEGFKTFRERCNNCGGMRSRCGDERISTFDERSGTYLQYSEYFRDILMLASLTSSDDSRFKLERVETLRIIHCDKQTGN